MHLISDKTDSLEENSISQSVCRYFLICLFCIIIGQEVLRKICCIKYSLGISPRLGGEIVTHILQFLNCCKRTIQYLATSVKVYVFLGTYIAIVDMMTNIFDRGLLVVDYIMYLTLFVHLAFCNVS